MPQHDRGTSSPPDLVRDQSHWPLGLFSIALGLAAGARALQYGVGSLRDMGPGFIPLACAVALIGLGAVLILRRGYDLGPDQAIVPWQSPQAQRAQVLRVLRVLGATLGGLAAFALILEPAGMVISIMVLTVVVSLAHPGPRLVPVLALAVALAAFASVVFVLALKVQVSIWPGGF